MDARNGVAVAAYREQTVEIALGPEGAFENGNVGTVTRRVVELLRKALEWQALLDSGGRATRLRSRREGITRARVTEVMGLLRLTPEIQQHILSMPNAVRRPAITERALRLIAQIQDRTEQGARFLDLIGQPE